MSRVERFENKVLWMSRVDLIYKCEVSYSDITRIRFNQNENDTFNDRKNQSGSILPGTYKLIRSAQWEVDKDDGTIFFIPTTDFEFNLNKTPIKLSLPFKLEFSGTAIINIGNFSHGSVTKNAYNDYTYTSNDLNYVGPDVASVSIRENKTDSIPIQGTITINNTKTDTVIWNRNVFISPREDGVFPPTTIVYKNGVNFITKDRQNVGKTSTPDNGIIRFYTMIKDKGKTLPLYKDIKIGKK